MTTAKSMLLRLDGPLQAWGTGSVFERRGTGPWPTKSGVLGMCAAALGMPRGAPLDRLAALDVAVRVDQAGQVITDFHTVGIDGWTNADGAVTVGQSKMSTRQYLADAVFVVAVGGPDEHIVEDIDNALRHPRYHPFLGRRSCPPAAPLRITVVDTDPVHALTMVPYQGRAHRPPARLLTVVSDIGGGIRVADQPISFAPLDRRYGMRATATHWITIPSAADAADPADPYGMGSIR